MPTIYDNQKISFLSGLTDALKRSHKSDICTAYFNLRGWKKLAVFIDQYKGNTNNQCRLLLGMYNPSYQLKQELLKEESSIDNKQAKKFREETLKKFEKQLTTGNPSNEDETALRKLAQQIKEKKLTIKLFTRYPLHAKLYLTFNKKEFAGKIGFLGSSNLTYAGLEKNGELNIDVLDQSSCQKLNQWFEDKWQDQYSIDISERVIDLISESWAREKLLPPYDIYMKMAYHLSEDARQGLTDFFIPKNLQDKLFDFQSAAVRIATHYVYRRNGVLIGDVVGLGKTLMAISVAKILEEEHGWQTLILCPKNLENMWEDQRQKWQIRATTIPISQVQKKLPNLRRHQIVIIDESHNLRNPLGKRYQVVKDYITQNDSKCILLSATPYNKTYVDLSSQLGLFIDPDVDLGIRPHKFLKESPYSYEGLSSSLKAFEQSTHSEDWQQLMAQFLVRRTRSFIKQNYGKKDSNGRDYIETSTKDKKFFPERIAKTIKYKVDQQYKRLFSQDVVNMINNLRLPRYDLYNYKKQNLKNLSHKEANILKDLKQSRSQPKGFCRINLFKRLESSGFAFLQSIQRHVLRNCIFIYAIDHHQDLIVREKSSELISDAFDDREGGMTGFAGEQEETSYVFTDFTAFYQKALEVYKKQNSQTLRWISSDYFTDKLKEDLKKDTDQMISLLKKSQDWQPEKDLKLQKLETMLRESQNKVLIFTQSRETATYLNKQLEQRGIKKVGLITGGMDNIQPLIKRFSPVNNDCNEEFSNSEIDILITTDVLSEGQNLQDCHTVINYDLPWAIIKLIQRVGRVDRIGQKSDKIFCYSFMPDEDLEKHIHLKDRIQNRLKENAEVIGTDEQFFENEKQILIDLYNENSNVLEKEILEDVDLSSYALEIWNKGIKQNPSLANRIKTLPNVVHASKSIAKSQHEGVLLFAKSHINNYLLHLNKKGESLTEDQRAILQIAKCSPDTKAWKRSEDHYKIVESGLKLVEKQLNILSLSGHLGNSRNPRRKIYDKLIFISNPDDTISQIIEDIYHYPLSHEVQHTLNRMFRRKIPDKDIQDFLLERYKNETLVNKKEAQRMDEKPHIVCSMGLRYEPK